MDSEAFGRVVDSSEPGGWITVELAEPDMDMDVFEQRMRERFFSEMDEGKVRVLPSHPDAEFMAVEPEDLESARAALYKARAALDKSRKQAARQAAELDRLRRELPRLQNARERLREVLSLFTDAGIGDGYVRTAYVAAEDVDVWRRDAQE